MLAGSERFLDQVKDHDWDWYHDQTPNFEPNPALIFFTNSLYWGGTEVMLLTARPEKYRSVTVAWLSKHGVSYTKLVMRPEEDNTNGSFASPLFKAAVASWYGERTNIVLAVDDHAGCIEEYKKLGITTAHIQSGQWNSDGTSKYD